MKGLMGRWLVIASLSAMIGLPAGHAADKSLVDPLVTVNASNQPLSEVLKGVSAQSGYNFDQVALRLMGNMLAGRPGGAAPGAAAPGGAAPGGAAPGGAAPAADPRMAAFRNMLDPTVTVNVTQVPLGWLMAQLGYQYNQRFERVGGTYFVAPNMNRGGGPGGGAATPPKTPFRQAGDMLVRVTGFRLEHQIDHTFGPKTVHDQTNRLTLDVSVDTPSPVLAASVAGIGVDGTELTTDPDLNAQLKPAAGVGDVIAAGGNTQVGDGIALPFAVKPGDLKQITSFNCVVKSYDQLKERIVSFTDLTKAGQAQDVETTSIKLVSYTAANGQQPATAVVDVTMTLNPVAAEQIRALGVDAAGKVDVPSVLDNNPAAGGGGGRRGGVQMRAIPLWLVPVVALAKPDGTLAYGRVPAEGRSYVLADTKLSGHLTVTWPDLIATPTGITVSVLDPGNSTKDQIVIFQDITIPEAHPLQFGRPGGGGPGGGGPGGGGPGGGRGPGGGAPGGAAPGGPAPGGPAPGGAGAPGGGLRG